MQRYVRTRTYAARRGGTRVDSRLRSMRDKLYRALECWRPMLVITLVVVFDVMVAVIEA